MAIVTTTHYVPDSSGWSHRGFYFRLKVVQAYNNLTNQSTLTVSLESYHATYSGTFNFLDASSDPAYIKADGNTLVTLGTAYKFKYAASTTWKQMTSSNATEWTYTVSHDSTGNAAVSFETAGRIYLYTGGTEYYGDMDKTMSYTFTGVRAFSLSISAGTGSTITVNRTSSPNQGADTGNLSDGDTIYYGDVLKITFGANTGYNLSTHTVNDSSFTSGNTKTVNDAVSIASTATVKSYSLSITTDENANVIVNRTSSPLQSAATGELSNGATIYYNDVLSITVSPNAGYEVKTATLNDWEIVSPHTVTDNVSIEVVSSPLGFAYIDINTDVAAFSMMIDTGSAIERFRAYIDNGTSIVPY